MLPLMVGGSIMGKKFGVMVELTWLVTKLILLKL
jgi:hypothetical protein